MFHYSRLCKSHAYFDIEVCISSKHVLVEAEVEVIEGITETVRDTVTSFLIIILVPCSTNWAV